MKLAKNVGLALPVANAPASPVGAEPGRPASVLEIRVTAGRLDINELYSQTVASALVRRLAALGISTHQVFHSWCG